MDDPECVVDQVTETKEPIPMPAPVDKPVETVVQPVKKSNKEERSSKKKDDKSLEQVLKALSSLGTTEEKLAVMWKKYSEVVDENRKSQSVLKQCEKRAIQLQREKEQLQAEQGKSVLTRSRLENLCRELQKQNKAIKDESLSKIREEEEKRKEVSAKFQSIINEITSLTQQNNENNTKLKEENLEMQKKFKTVCEQYELREQQYDKISKQMQLETQLADAKLAKAKLEMVAEKEILMQEKKQLLLELTAYQNKCQELQATEIGLRSQISLYTDKYDEFQNALVKSNQVYGGFKGEMEKMSKKITKLEKETSTWKLKWEGSHKALLQMAADKQTRDAEYALQSRKLNQLQKLCRTLQSDRTALLSQLKNEGINPKLPNSDNNNAIDTEIVNDSKIPAPSENIDNTTSTIPDNVPETVVLNTQTKELSHLTPEPVKDTESQNHVTPEPAKDTESQDHVTPEPVKSIEPANQMAQEPTKNTESSNQMAPAEPVKNTELADQMAPEQTKNTESLNQMAQEPTKITESSSQMTPEPADHIAPEPTKITESSNQMAPEPMNNTESPSDEVCIPSPSETANAVPTAVVINSECVKNETVDTESSLVVDDPLIAQQVDEGKAENVETVKSMGDAEKIEPETKEADFKKSKKDRQKHKNKSQKNSVGDDDGSLEESNIAEQNKTEGVTQTEVVKTNGTTEQKKKEQSGGRKKKK